MLALDRNSIRLNLGGSLPWLYNYEMRWLEPSWR